MIEDVLIRKIIDSRGNVTVEVDIYTSAGCGRCAAPSGASVGKHEAVAFPQAVDQLIAQFNERVRPELIGRDASDQREIDAVLREIDGTENFAGLGGNIAVATSLAVAKAGADEQGLPLYRYLNPLANSLPYPAGNVLGGGKHCVGGPAIQEFLAVAFGETAFESIAANAQVHSAIKTELKKRFPNAAIGKGDEGAWVAQLNDEETVALLGACCEKVSERTGTELRLGIDGAASSFYRDGKYVYKDQTLDVDGQLEFIERLVESYGIFYLEDPLFEDDFDAYSRLTKRVGDRCKIIGDDLFVTNKKRLERGIELGACNAILIKPNQVGTLTDTYETIELAKAHGYTTVVSHRSGETTDETIAHLAVAFGCEFIKTGTVGGERIAKLNELIRIEEALHD